MAPTAYMLFCNQHRESVRQRLAAEGQEKIAVTVVAKEVRVPDGVSTVWRQVSRRTAHVARGKEYWRGRQQGMGYGSGALARG